MTSIDDPAATSAEVAALSAKIDELMALTAPGAPTPFALDAFGNPGQVVSGELIESAWGNAVDTRVAYRYPTHADFLASGVGLVDGRLFAIGPMLYVVRGGRLAAISAAYWSRVGISGGGNIVDGTTVLLAGIPLPAEFVDYMYAIHVVSGVTNASAAGTLTLSLRDSTGTVVFDSEEPGSYEAGRANQIMALFQASVPASPGPTNLTLYCFNTGGTINVAGNINVIRYPA